MKMPSWECEAGETTRSYREFTHTCLDSLTIDLIFYSHGRDNKLIVWKLSQDDEANLSKVLPVEDVPEPRAQPWILHLLEVNTMNFCAFSACSSSPGVMDNASEILVAVPNTLQSEAVRNHSLI
jgi:hypothetical protein